MWFDRGGSNFTRWIFRVLDYEVPYHEGEPLIRWSMYPPRSNPSTSYLASIYRGKPIDQPAQSTEVT